MSCLTQEPLRKRNAGGTIRGLKAQALAGAVALLLFPLAGIPDILNTKHNLSRRDGGIVDPTAVCVYCHTPQSSPATTARLVPPRWQASPAGVIEYPIYDHLGRRGRDNSNPVGSQSIACLSCHDGGQAGGIAGKGVDHPFSVPYRGSAGVAVAYTDPSGVIATGEGQAFDDPGFRPAVRSVVGADSIWWVPTSNFSTARRGKNDIPLYPRTVAGGGEVPFVECSSCHDPHNETVTFLRIPNRGSQLCLTCHRA